MVAGVGPAAGRPALASRLPVPPMAPRLSVCLTTFNMGHFLPRVLDNIAPVADEIVVCDTHSTDGTLDLLAARDEDIKVVTHTFERHYGRLKNAAMEPATGDWILLLDSDELLGDTLRARLPQLIRSRWRSFYKLPRYWVVDESPLQYVDAPKLYPDYQLRLFRNTPFWRYGDDMAVHEHFPRKGRGRGKKLTDAHLFHYSFVLMSREQREAKAAEYTGIDAGTESTSEMYLWEQSGAAVKACAEGLTA